MTEENTQTRTTAMLIDVREVATILDLSQRSIWRLVSEGQIIAPIRIGRSVKWRREELNRWIAEGCPIPTPPKRPR